MAALFVLLTSLSAESDLGFLRRIIEHGRHEASARFVLKE
jgi:hypothetical protein